MQTVGVQLKFFPNIAQTKPIIKLNTMLCYQMIYSDSAQFKELDVFIR